jgi:hypothetical protein
MGLTTQVATSPCSKTDPASFVRKQIRPVLFENRSGQFCSKTDPASFVRTHVALQFFKDLKATFRIVEKDTF